MKAKVGDRIRLNDSLAFKGIVVEAKEREILPSTYKVKWDDEKLGTGILYEWEFEVVND